MMPKVYDFETTKRLMMGIPPGTSGKPSDAKPDAAQADPADAARLAIEAMTGDGVPTQRQWQGQAWAWVDGAYRPITREVVRSTAVRFFDHHYRNLTTTAINNILEHLRAHTHLPATTEPPAWLGEPVNGWAANDLLVTRSQLLHLPTLASGLRAEAPATPRLFVTSALGFDYQYDAPPPAAWLEFLDQLWGTDEQAKRELQKWFGYCLTPDTRQQKILLLIGPKRGGKGTITRVLRELVGPANCAGPTLSSFAQNFGLQGLLGKSLAIVSDARLSGHADQAVIVERLLSISGEDALTIDRKHMEAVTAKLASRLMVLTNELPRLADSSGALAGRFIVLRLTESFYGREDHTLTERLIRELPGILKWSIQGWQHLRDDGCFWQPDASEEMIAELDELGSPVSAFINERCAVGPAFAVHKDELYSEWVAWCETNGRKHPGTAASFGRDLLAAVPGLKTVRPREGETRHRAYQGVAIRGGF
jgi:putative DNA primase/helicase